MINKNQYITETVVFTKPTKIPLAVLHELTWCHFFYLQTIFAHYANWQNGVNSNWEKVTVSYTFRTVSLAACPFFPNPLVSVSFQSLP